MAELKTAVDQKTSKSLRSVSMHLSNNTQSYILINPQIYTESGYCCGIPQPTVGKGVTETFTFVKKFGTFGAVGVLTYDIAEEQKKTAIKRLAIMFSVPFEQVFFHNCFALGFFDTDKVCDQSLYELMYSGHGLNSKMEKASGSEMRFQYEKFTLRGTMSKSWNALMKVELWENEDTKGTEQS